MARIIKEITLELSKPNMFQAIIAKQYDSGSRFLEVTFRNEGEIVPVEEGSKVTINANREDGESKSFEGEVVTERGTAIVPLHSWMLELPGTVNCDVSIIDTDQRKLTSTTFTLTVQDAANGSDAISEDENYDLLTELFTRCDDAVIAAESAVGAANNAIESINAVIVGQKTADGGEIFNDYDETEGNAASAAYAHAEGRKTAASGHASHAEGFGTQATATNAHAEGRDTIASGTYGSHAEGYQTQAVSRYSHAEGLGTKAGESDDPDTGGRAAHAEGYNTSALGEYSHAEGNANTAEGAGSHAEGAVNTASGESSHVEGRANTASGVHSHAEGFQTTASGVAGHSEGFKTKASGKYAHAEGNQTVASGDYSHACGLFTQATVTSQTVVGKYNKENADALFIVGNGTQTVKRSNAFEVLADGGANLNGSPLINLDYFNGNAEDVSNKLTSIENVDDPNNQYPSFSALDEFVQDSLSRFKEDEELESAEHKLQTIDEEELESDDYGIQYPSAKAVVEYVGGALARFASEEEIESQLDKLTAIDEFSGDETYPSSKAVVDYVNDKLSDKEDKSNKIADMSNVDLSELPDAYPSAQAVSQALFELDESVAKQISDVMQIFEGNKLTHIDEEAVMDDDSHIYYPSAKGMVNYVNSKIGEIETALDNIIAIQNTLIGGAIE